MVTRTKKIFVGGLSAATTLEEVKAYFQRFGEVSPSDCFSSHHHSHDHEHHHDHVVARGNHHPDSKEILHNNVLNHHQWIHHQNPRGKIQNRPHSQCPRQAGAETDPEMVKSINLDTEILLT